MKNTLIAITICLMMLGQPAQARHHHSSKVGAFVGGLVLGAVAEAVVAQPTRTVTIVEQPAQTVTYATTTVTTAPIVTKTVTTTSYAVMPTILMARPIRPIITTQMLIPPPLAYPKIYHHRPLPQKHKPNVHPSKHRRP